MIKTLFTFLAIMFLMGCSNEGTLVPDFSLETMDGDILTQESLKGKIVVIDVWATWCGNCISELPKMNKLARQYQGDPDILLLAVSAETKDKVSSFLAKRPFNFKQIPQAMALTDALQTRLVKTYPQHIILNKESVIAYQSSGELATPQATLSEEIEKLR